MTSTRVRAPKKARMRYDPETGEILDPPAPKEKTPIEAVNARLKSVSRSKTKIRRAVQMMQADHLLTLTYRRNETDLEQAWRDAIRFIRAMRDALGEFRYVIVAERQKRGAWHFHLAVRGRQNLPLIRDCWARAGGCGNIDVKLFKGPVHRLAGYLSKYIAKSFSMNDDERGGTHRFKRSKGISPPEIVSLVTCDPSEAWKLMRELFEEQGLIGFAQCEGGERGEIDHYVWGCTWLESPSDGPP